MSVEKNWDSFLEDFLWKTVLRHIYLFREASVLDAKVSVSPDENIDSSLQEDGNFEKVR